MSAESSGPNKAARQLDVTASDADLDSTARGDHTQMILDGLDDHGPDTDDAATPTPETPPDPMQLTVDFQPDPKPVSDDAPLLTITDITEVGIGSKPGVPLAPPPVSAVRHSVPGYEILRELGRGGMGVVYEARQKGLNRLVALKMILSGDHASPGEHDRFRREAESVAALQHPNIVHIYEIGEVEGRPYLAFEFIEGGTLAQHLEGNPWPPRAAAALVEILARAVQYAHERGIVHRDLKPGNILLAAGKESRAEISLKKTEDKGSKSEGNKKTDRDGRMPIPKITDFGLAKKVERESEWSTTGEIGASPQVGNTRTGAVMGTPSYIAPEQAAGKNRDVGPPADVYALGAILYELLTGRPPFRGETALDTVLQVMSDDPVPPRRLQPKVPRDLETICLMCLQKSPAKRYHSAGALAEDLRRFANHEPIEARPIGSRERLVKWAKRHPAAATSLFGSILALVTMLSISFYFNFELRRLAEDKESEAGKAIKAQLAAERSAKEKDDQTRIANEQRKKADERLKDVEKARKEAERATQDALKREEQARRAAYALALNRAMALVERDPFRAALLLDKKEECPFELRDFTWHYLREMCRVDHRFLVGHLKTVTKVVYSADGTRIATASWDGTVRVWDAASHQAIAVLKEHQGVVRSVAFGPDGRTLVTAGMDHHIYFWELPLHLPDAGAGQPPVLRSWASDVAGDIQSLAVSPDGRFAASGSMDGKIRIWTIPGPPRAGMMALGGGGFSAVIRTPDAGVTPVYGPALPMTFRLGPPRILNAHTSAVMALVWIKEGLFSGGRDTAVRLWQPDEKDTGELVYQNAEPILTLDVSPGAEFLAVTNGSSDDASIHLWSLLKKQEVARLRSHTRPVEAVAFSPDGKHLASASQDGTVRFWETGIWIERSVFRGHKEQVRSVAFSPDLHTLATGGMDSTVRFWPLITAREKTVETTVRAPLPAAAVSAGNGLLAMADRDGSIRVWPRGANGYDKTHAFLLRGIPGRVTALAVSPKGDLVAAVVAQRDDWTVCVWTLPTGAPAKVPIELKTPKTFKGNGEVHGLALHGNMLAVAAKNGAHAWKIDTQKPILKTATTDVRAVAFTPDGRKLLSASDRIVQVLDMATGNEECRMPFGHVKEKITSIAVGPPLEDFDPQSWTVVTSDPTGASWVWSLHAAKPGPDGKPRPVGQSMVLDHTAILTGHAEPVTSVSFATDGKTIATSSEDRTIRLWDPITGRERAVLATHTDSVLLAAFLPGGEMLLSVGREGAVKLWHSPR